MMYFTPTTKRTVTGMAVVGVMIVTTAWAPVHGGLFDCFRKDYQPKNIFIYPERLPLTLRRVVLLPLAPGNDNGLTSAGCEALAPVLKDELTKAGRFEVVSVNPKDLRRFSGRTAWADTDVLPTDFMSSLRRVYGGDAVLFCQLTEFRAYPPMLIGWRLKLVDTGTSQVIWAADEVFDMSNPAVAQAARHFEERQAAHPDLWTMTHSPRRFGHYTVAALLACLPER